MDFISNQKPQIEAMLQDLGIHEIAELFRDIPSNLVLAPPKEDDGISEYAGMKLMEEIATQNSFHAMDNYLGAGAYEHHVPAIVSAICSKSEFLTSYTPYQAEISQGMLQVIFEFQSAICALTGLDVANASLYDGATAAAEAALIALRHNKNRRRLLISSQLHPHYQAVVKTYLQKQEISLDFIPTGIEGSLDLEALDSKLNDNVAGILVQSPNFLGIIEDVKTISDKAKAVGALSILVANPLSYGLFASARELGADIAVGDGQPFGIPLQFGGPYVGYLSVVESLIRQVPGRIVGETIDVEGSRGFVLTLQAREQHIRREKATSNICTNQSLAALACLIGLLWYGKEGIQKLALANYQRAAYLKKNLFGIPGVSFLSNAPTFNEFAVSFSQPADTVQKHFRKHHMIPGLDLGPFNKKLEGYFLVAATEVKSKQQLDRYCEVAAHVQG